MSGNKNLPVTQVSMAFDDPEQVETHEVRVFSVKEKPGSTEMGGDSEGHGFQFEEETFIGVGLGKERLLLIDATDMKKSGRYPATRKRKKDGKIIPAMFFVVGENVYYAEKNAEVQIDHSKDGVKVAAKNCQMKLMNLEVDKEKKTYREKRDVPKKATVSMAMPGAVPLRKLELEPSHVYAESNILGVVPTSSDQELAKRGDAAQDALCWWLAIEVARHLSAANSLLSQWWNPWALISGASELTQAWICLASGKASGCW
jgi:hypothetical protein